MILVHFRAIPLDANQQQRVNSRMLKHSPRPNKGLQAVLESAKRVGELQTPPLTPMQLIARTCGCTVQAVCKWKHIPHLHVLKLESLTGVSRYTQRPDIYGAPIPAAATKNRSRPKLRQPRSRTAA
jgi:hypothetical protein